MAGPVTIADIARSGVLLLVCCRCGHRAELAAGGLPLRPTTPIPKIENRFRCTASGAKNTPTDHPVKALMDPRQKGQEVGIRCCSVPWHGLEKHGRTDDGGLVHLALGLSRKHPVSRNWKWYWQRGNVTQPSRAIQLEFS